MAGINDITGDKLQSKVNSDAYRSGWDLAFGNKKKDSESHIEAPEDVQKED